MKMNNKRNKALMLLVLWAVAFSVSAQNGLNLPYSQFGVGDLKAFYSHPYINSMGGLSYTLRKDNVINNNNPASYAAIDSNSFVFDMGLGFDFITFANEEKSLYDADAALTHIMVGLPLTKRWRSSLGIVPYSEVSYLTAKDLKTLTNGDSLFSKSVFDGTGGITKLYWGHAIKITDNLSVGFNANYLFGKETRAITFEFPDSAYMLNSRKLRETHVSNFTFDFGLQYFCKLNKDYTLGVGLTFSPRMSLNVTDQSVVYTFATSSQMDYARDTIVPLAEYKSVLDMPMIVGGGLSLIRNEKWMVGFDVTYSEWNMPKYTESTEIFGDWNVMDYTKSLRFVLGGEKMGDVMETNYIDRMSFRCGAHFEKGKLKVFDKEMNDFGLHAGMSFPVRKMKSLINVTFQWGVYGMKEVLAKNYFQIGVSLSTSDTWFKKLKYD